MRKLLLIAMLILGLTATAQKPDTTKMPNYEKYLLVKEQAAKPDTIVKYDTVYVEAQKPEYDDLYYTPSKDQLKLKKKDLRLRKKEIRMEQDSLYYDAKTEVYNDLSFTAQIYRFHRPYYGFEYYNYYWDPFYNPWFLDSWYYGGYPYYEYGFGYPYYHNYWGFGYGSWYFNGGWNYSYYPNYYGYNYYNNYYGYNSSIQYGRRERPSTYSYSQYTTSYRSPVTVNKTIQIDRRTGQVLGIQNEGQRRVSTIARRNVNTQVERTLTQSQNRRVNTITSPNRTAAQSRTSTQSRSYTPTYSIPRMSTRPMYNNTNRNSTRLNNE